MDLLQPLGLIYIKYIIALLPNRSVFIVWWNLYVSIDQYKPIEQSTRRSCQRLQPAALHLWVLHYPSSTSIIGNVDILRCSLSLVKRYRVWRLLGLKMLTPHGRRPVFTKTWTFKIVHILIHFGSCIQLTFRESLVNDCYFSHDPVNLRTVIVQGFLNPSMHQHMFSFPSTQLPPQVSEIKHVRFFSSSTLKDSKTTSTIKKRHYGDPASQGFRSKYGSNLICQIYA